MLRIVAAAALAVATIACGSTLRETDGQAGAAADHQRADPNAGATASPTQSAGPTATPAPNCVVLAQIAPAPAPGLAMVDLGNDTQRVTSVEAGYSVVVPSSWHVLPGHWSGASPSFGQAHVTSYDPNAVDIRDPAKSLAFGRMMWPDVGIRLDIELWLNPQRETAEGFAKNVHIGPDQTAVLPGRPVTVAGQRAYHAIIQDEFKFQPTSGPLEITRQTRLLWLVPALRADRMLVIYATPGESALRSRAEAAVTTLELSPAIVSRFPVMHQRDALLQRWLYDKAGAPIAGRRAEAKLTTYAEAAAALKSGVMLRIDRDPEELFWIVAVSGPDLPEPKHGLIAPPSPRPTTWIQYTTPAMNSRYEGTSTQYSHNGTWPPDFDAIVDRCH